MTIHNASALLMEARELIGSLYPAQERKNLEILKIKGDASNRQYFRVSGPHGTSIACIDPAFRAASPESYPFLIMRNSLAAHGIRVPEILASDPREGLLIIEDCGDLMLQDEVASLDNDELSARYRQVLDILVRIQSISPDGSAIPFSLSFDHEKLMFEFDFFIEHALNNYFSGVLDKDSITSLRREFEAIALLLVRPEHFVLNHRDFHSRNIMLFRNEPVVIDFQDARLGLPQYDAVSLLRDSYVRLDPQLVDELKQYHYDQLCINGLTTMDADEYRRFFDLMAFQRNVKAVGTFCYQTAVAGNRSFEPDIAPTMAYLSDYIDARAELAVAGRLLKPLISPGFS
ncbi:MAG TPA: phosphotransferase [Chlorobaculum sp.]|nr:phosphotransferase [Chlorobaculum sp.]